MIKEARNQLLKSLSLPTNILDDDQRLKDLVPPFKTQLRQTSKAVLIEEEVRRRRWVRSQSVNLRLSLTRSALHAGL